MRKIDGELAKSEIEFRQGYRDTSGRFAVQFAAKYGDGSGGILWDKLLKDNSGAKKSE